MNPMKLSKVVVLGLAATLAAPAFAGTAGHSASPASAPAKDKGAKSKDKAGAKSKKDAKDKGAKDSDSDKPKP